jgi:hypothetical protein
MIDSNKLKKSKKLLDESNLALEKIHSINKS